jgi:UDP-N-acetylmuramoyl-L-alanyl-D-glutamate--2,6-diaminopimelate ligase
MTTLATLTSRLGTGLVELVGDPETEVTDVTHDSRAVVPGALFACLRGARSDGHDFADAAASAGAAAVLVDHRLDRLGDTPQIVVDDTRLRLGPVASAVAGDPSTGLTTVGITGTNGKTTTAQLLAHVLEAIGRPTGVIGTLHGPRTTPEAPDLQRALAGFRDAGKEAAVLEVSSHALALHRADGTRFDVVAFTNFGRDHLDLHGSQEEYFRAKASLFTPEFAPQAVVNVDDPHGRLLADAIGDAMQVVEVSACQLDDVVVTADRSEFTWRGRPVRLALGGGVNVANAHLALTIASVLGVDEDAAARALATVPPVPGRFERVDHPGADAAGVTVVVDYAHTPDGLATLIPSARDLIGDEGRVLVVFGCGGGRDREKRPEMGEVAARLADVVVVTSDNPREEDPEAIIAEIVAGIPPGLRSRVSTVSDRRAAIAAALDTARRGDLVVVAGKGHETTQEIGDRVVEFDDRAVVRSLLGSTVASPPASEGSSA